MDDEKELDDVLKEAIKEAEEAENSRVLYEKKMRFLGRMNCDELYEANEGRAARKASFLREEGQRDPRQT